MLVLHILVPNIINYLTGKKQTIHDTKSHISNYGRPNLVVSCDKHNLIKTIATILFIFRHQVCFSLFGTYQ